MNPRNLSDSNEVMSVITGVGRLSLQVFYAQPNVDILIHFKPKDEGNEHK